MNKKSAVFAICLFGAALANAEPPKASAPSSVKCGVIEVEYLLKNAVISKEAKQRLEQEFKPRKEALERKATELRRLQDQHDAAQKEKNQQKVLAIQAQIDDLDPAFGREADAFKRDLANKRDAEVRTVLKAAESAYKKLVAKEGYQRIYQTSEADPVYSAPGTERLQCSVKKDISVDIIKILDADAEKTAK